MTPQGSILLTAVAGLVVAALGAWRLVVPAPELSAALRSMAAADGTTTTVPMVERLGRPLRRALAWSVRGRLGESTRSRLDAAGSDTVRLEAFCDRRAGFALLGVVTAFFLYRDDHPFLAVVLGGAVAITADLSLRRRASARQDEIERDLPDVLDTVAVALRAGAMFRPTMARIVRIGTGALVEELGAALAQMDLGVSRREAFARVQRRNRSPLLRQLTGAVLQAEELGTSLADTLAALAEDMRRRSGQLARERADRVEKRVVLVNAALFLPAMMLMLVSVSLLGFGVSGALGSP